MLRFLAFLLGLILGFNGSGSEPETPNPGQNPESGQKTALVVPPVNHVGEAEAGSLELRFPSFEVERGRGLLHKA
jgi:hypothetical protein